MRKTIIAILATLLTISAVHAAPKTFKIDPDHALVAFKVDHIGYAKVLGQFLKVSGEFVYDTETATLGRVSVTVDANSVFSNQQARDKHIRGRDFLDTETAPEITFQADGGKAETETTGTVTGALTVRGVTRPVTLDVRLNKAGPYPFGHKKFTLGISASATIKRSEWGMTYALGGIVGDDVELIIEVEAILQD